MRPPTWHKMNKRETAELTQMDINSKLEADFQPGRFSFCWHRWASGLPVSGQRHRGRRGKEVHLAGPRGAQTSWDALSVSRGLLLKRLWGSCKAAGAVPLEAPPRVSPGRCQRLPPQGKRRSTCLFSAVRGGQRGADLVKERPCSVMPGSFQTQRLTPHGSDSRL